MKRKGVCPKCQQRRIGRVERVFDDGVKAQRYLGLKGGLFKSRAGRVEAYVCTACGYFEEYVVAPEQVAWEDLEGFTWHSVDGGEGPFR